MILFLNNGLDGRGFHATASFNGSVLGGNCVREDARWKFGVPSTGNANYAWVQHFIHHLAPTGMAGLVSANGSMSSNQSGEGEIRKAIIEAGFVDCLAAAPGQSVLPKRRQEGVKKSNFT